MKVFVERNIEQICDGIHYKGYLKIAGISFDYELRFEVPIPQMDDEMELASNEVEIRRLVKINVKKNDESLDLTKDEYGFFFLLLVDFAVDFYNNPQTRSLQNSIIGKITRGEGFLAEMGGSASIGISRADTYDFKPDLCKILSAPKFGCVLTN